MKLISKMAFILLVVFAFSNQIINSLLSLNYYFWTYIAVNKIYVLITLFKIVLFIGLLYFVNNYLIRYPHKIVIPILFSIFTLLGIIVIQKSEIRLHDDPLSYFQFAVDIVTNKIPYNIGNIYHQRISLYTIPVFLLFPNKLLSVQLCNIFFILLTGYLLYKFIRKNTNNEIALITLFIFLFLPVQYGVVSLPWHDNIANAYLLLFFIFLNRFTDELKNKQRIIYGILFIGLCALMLFFTDTVRSTGLLVIASIIISLFFVNFSKQAKYYFAIFSIIILFSILKSGKESHYPKGSSFKKQYGLSTVLYSYNDLLSEGSYNDGYESRSQFVLPFFESEKIKNYAITKYTTQIAEYPIEFLKTYFIKTNHLLQISSRSRFYNETGSLINENFHKKLDMIEKLLRVLIFSFSIIGLFYIGFKYTYNYSLTVFIFFGILFIPLIFLSQISPGYSYVILPQISFWSAIGMQKVLKTNYKRFFKKKKFKSTILYYTQKLVKPFLLGSVSLLFAFLLLYGGTNIYKNLNSNELYNFDHNTYTLKNAELISPQNQTQRHYSILIQPDALSDTVELFLKSEEQYSNITMLLKTTSIDTLKVTIQDKSPISFNHSVDLRPEKAENVKRDYYMVEHTLNRNDSLIRIQLIGLNLSNSLKSTIEFKDLMLTKYQ